MSAEIECPVCARIEFAGGSICQACRWPFSVTREEDRAAFGYEVLCEVRTGMVGTREDPRHYKGNEMTARRRAKSVPNFVRVLAVRPLTEAQYVRAYGDGRM